MTEPTGKSEQQSVSVSIRPSGQGKGVYEISVQVDNDTPGSSVVRTSPKHFAFQYPNPSVNPSK
jgi:hypothetical protein